MIILHLQQTFEDASGSKCDRVLNMARLYMQGLRRVPNIMAPYSKVPNKQGVSNKQGVGTLCKI